MFEPPVTSTCPLTVFCTPSNFCGVFSTATPSIFIFFCGGFCPRPGDTNTSTAIATTSTTARMVARTIHTASSPDRTSASRIVIESRLKPIAAVRHPPTHHTDRNRRRQRPPQRQHHIRDQSEHKKQRPENLPLHGVILARTRAQM